MLISEDVLLELAGVTSSGLNGDERGEGGRGVNNAIAKGSTAPIEERGEGGSGVNNASESGSGICWTIGGGNGRSGAASAFLRAEKRNAGNEDRTKAAKTKNEPARLFLTLWMIQYIAVSTNRPAKTTPMIGSGERKGVLSCRGWLKATGAILQK